MKNEVSVGGAICNGKQGSISAEYPWYALDNKFSVLFLLFIPLISCNPVLEIIYGVHQPRYVSDTDVIRYAEKIDWESDIYRLKDYAEDRPSKYRYLGNRLPEILVFNSQGLITKFEIDCSSDLYSITTLTPGAIDSMEVGEHSFEDFIANTYVINNGSVEEMISFHTPIYVVKFAEFVGKINKDNVPKQIAILSKRRDVKYVVLNMDFTIEE
jgi:hypothetical protein